MRIAGQNKKKHTRTCVWCGVLFNSSRPDAKTCSNSHRSRLHDYVKRFGCEPSKPVGVHVTARLRFARDRAHADQMSKLNDTKKR